jgi:hypothetical protein
MEDLAEWLRAQFDEDERIARGCSGMEWWEHPKNWVSAPPLNRIAVVVHDGDRGHIARHDPARVLREIDAKRQILDTLHEEGGDRMFADIFRLLALPYLDRPGYREE